MTQQPPLYPAGAGDPAAAPAWPWDLVGLPWAQAEPLLQAKGLTYETMVTAPPNRPVGVGELRVVAERRRPEGLLLLLAHRTYERDQPSPEGPR